MCCECFILCCFVLCFVRLLFVVLIGDLCLIMFSVTVPWGRGHASPENRLARWPPVVRFHALANDNFEVTVYT